VDGEAKLLRWAMNNISYAQGSSPIIGKAVETARVLGWPAKIEGTVDVPLDPLIVWNYTEPVDGPGGPGAALGSLNEAVVMFKEGEVVEFVLQNARALNGAAEFHPWHIHGHSFWVVGQGEGIFDVDTDVPTYNLDNPVLRDTVSLQPLGWVAVRFVADNPGAWLFHCHIVAHHVMGMEFVMIVEPDALGDASASVEFCNDQQLNESTSNSGGTVEGGSNSTSGALHHVMSIWATAALVMLLPWFS
jgi:Multicopper oxidase